MSGFFGRIFGRGKDESSAEAAKRRLQFVLVHDRINLPPDVMAAMKEEILQVISKYVQVAGESIDIALQPRDGEINMLIAEIPFAKTLSNRTTVEPDDDDLNDDPVA
jgi:cell division topological specificity factor